jgi:23S rRNA pseudouridine1911/1915/1917 synthase
VNPGSWRVDDDRAGVRLDRAVALHLDLPRNQIQEWIRNGQLTVDGKLQPKPGHLLRAGEEIAWTPPARIETRVLAEEGELRLLHCDDDLVVLDKPAGLTVHPGAGQSSGTLVHRLLARFPEMAGVGGPGRPGIVHRLDKGTSGVLVVARTAECYRALTAAFAARRIEKRYLAIVHGTPKSAAGTIEAPIGRHAVERKRMAVRTDGRPATTRYKMLASAAGLSLIELELLTGRTHQIRVHLKHLRHPIVGDSTYGEARDRELAAGLGRAVRAFARPALHAWRLGFEHPVTGAQMRFEAPLAADMLGLWLAIAGVEPVLPSFPD